MVVLVSTSGTDNCTNGTKLFSSLVNGSATCNCSDTDHSVTIGGGRTHKFFVRNGQKFVTVTESRLRVIILVPCFSRISKIMKI